MRKKTERGTYGVMFSVLMSSIKAASKSEYNRKKMYLKLFVKVVTIF